MKSANVFKNLHQERKEINIFLPLPIKSSPYFLWKKLAFYESTSFSRVLWVCFLKGDWLTLHFAAGHLDDARRGVVSSAHHVGDVLCHRAAELRQEAANERVSCAVRVNDLLLLHRRNGVVGHDTVSRDERVFPTLCEDNRALTSSVLLRKAGSLGRHLADVLAVPTHRLAERHRLRLVSEEVVNVRQEVLQRLQERGHLHDERRAEVQAVHLVLLAAVLRHLHHRVGRHGDEESGAVDNLRRLHHRPVLRLLEVRDLVVVRRREVRDEAALAVLDAHRARAGGRRLVHHVAYRDVVRRSLRLHLLAELVVSDASHVSGARVRRLQHPLADADGVLRRATGNVLDGEVGHHLGEHGRVFLLGEDLVRHLQAVLVEEFLRYDGADV
mmetsp:Transcript_12077/g.31971  ORF Transcript_12077/g.31971 Transcript_12077/m.31971 type:complete len:385 (+) Transcript_12077:2738-3892(+)